MRKVSLTGLLFVAIAWSAQGQEISRVGTAGGQFLKFGVGARAAALGEAYAAFSGDASCLYWNPAGIAPIKKNALLISHLSLFLDLAYHFVGAVYSIGRGSALGLHAIYLSSDKIEITTIEEPNGTGQFYDVEDLAVGLTYARAITDRLMVGLTAKFVQEGIYREQARTFAFDAGTIMDTGFLGMRLGLSLSNLGGKLQLRGPDLKIKEPIGPGGSSVELSTEPWPLPLTVRMGLTTDLTGPKGQWLRSEENRMILALDINDPSDAFLRSNLVMQARLFTAQNQTQFPQPNNFLERYRVREGISPSELEALTYWKVHFKVEVDNVFDETIDGTKFINVQVKIWENNSRWSKTLSYVDTTSSDSLILHPKHTYRVFSGNALIWDQTTDLGRSIHRWDSYQTYMIVARRYLVNVGKGEQKVYQECDTLGVTTVDTVRAFEETIVCRAKARVQIFKEYPPLETREIEFSIRYLFPEGLKPKEQCVEGFVGGDG